MSSTNVMSAVVAPEQQKDVNDNKFFERASAIAKKSYPNQPDGFPFGNLDINQIKLPKGDDFGIPSDEENIDIENEIEEESGFQSVISLLLTIFLLKIKNKIIYNNNLVVDNIPVVPPEKIEKLTNVIKKIFGGVGNISTGHKH